MAIYNSNKTVRSTLLKHYIDIVKTIPLESALAFYGLEIDNKHFALCPFHLEKTPSLKIFPDGRWHCFGCERNGDLIDYVQGIFEVNIREAIYKINTDFSLGMDLEQPPTVGDYIRANNKIREAKRERKEAQREYERACKEYEGLMYEFLYVQDALKKYKPPKGSGPGTTTLDPRFSYALINYEMLKHAYQESEIPVLKYSNKKNTNNTSKGG